MAPSRVLVSLSVLALLHVACDGPGPTSSSTPADAGGVASFQAGSLAEKPLGGPVHVLTLALADCGAAPFRYQYLEAVVDPPLPPGQAYVVSLTVDGDTGGRPLEQTLANLGEFECGTNWQPYDFDSSPLPNQHRVSRPATTNCMPRTFFVFSAIDAKGVIAPRLTTTVTGFEVPGQRTAIAGPTTFTCP